MRLGKLAPAAAAAIVLAQVQTPRAIGIGPRDPAARRPSPREDPLAAPAPDAGIGPQAGEPAEVAPEPKQRGVALGLFAEDVGFSFVPLLREIAALGATHVALVVPVYQSDVRATSLKLHTRFSPTLGLIADTVRAARRERLEVTLFPIVRLEHAAPGEWRGTLAPSDPGRWFRSYGDLLGDLAAVAAQTGAARLVVGSELSTLDTDLDRWRPLLERVRALFRGPLVYSANWDHYQDARLFELVDEDGIAAYFSLRDSQAAATDAALEAGWKRHQQALAAWRRGRPHPLVLTELGYRSRAGSSSSPWDETSGGTPDVEEQRRAFAAFRRVWAGTRVLDGVYIWNWYGWGGPDSVSYTPRGKPATEEIRHLLQDL